jgi:TonB-dependent receptor
MIGRITKTNSITPFLFIILFSALFILTNPLVLQAQPEGNITGRITEATTKSVLPGANIVIEGSGRGAAADPNGRFTILDLAPGSYTLTASFLGYQAMNKEIEVIANQTVSLNFALMEDILTGETVQVYGELTRGQAKALQRQKMAQNIVQVVDEEFFGRFPDRNAAETVRRLPSISISRDQGEGEFVQIRGMSEEYNSVNLNGIRIPAPDENDGARSVGLDLINNRLLGEIEVIKAITPEMDGDAVGGVINFGLRRAPNEGTLVVGVAGGINNQISDFDTYGKGIQDFYAVFGERFFDNKLGLLLDAAYYKTNRHSKLRELNYANEGDTGPYSDVIVQQHTNDYDLRRQRYGFSIGGDYEFDGLNRIYLTYNQNTYLDDEIRREDEFFIEDNEEERTTRNRVEDQRLNLAMFGGEHNLGWFKLDYKGAWIYATENLPDRTYLRYGRDVDFSGYSNEEAKNFDGTTKFPGADPLELNRVRYDDDQKSDKDLSGQINISVPFRFMGGDRSNVKFGTKILRKSVSRERHRYQLNDFTQTLTTPEGTFGFEDVRYNDQALSQYYDEPFGERDNLVDSYRATETITGIYAMTQLNFSPEFSAMAGVRLEDTQTDYTQPYLDEDLVDIIGSDAALTGKGGYNNILPSIHLMYRLDNNNNLKLAYSTGLARPRYTSLIPRMSIDELPSSNSDLSGRINYGNPDLEPRTAYNFDLMYDRFSPYLGVISVGLFYKQFKAWQTSRTFTEEHDWVDDAGEDGADGVFETYRASQPVMGDGTATYFGIELNIQQRLLPLSDMLRWFTLNANFTYTYTKGELDGRTVVMTRSPKYITNGSVMYDNTDLGLSVVVALNYRDAILGGLEVTDYGPDKYLDTWFDSEFFVDISVMQKITDKLLIIGQLNGMGSTDERETLGDPRESYSRTQQLEQYGIYGTVGLQYTFW